MTHHFLIRDHRGELFAAVTADETETEEAVLQSWNDWFHSGVDSDRQFTATREPNLVVKSVEDCRRWAKRNRESTCQPS